jgi:phospholipid/cholesterol/gamma-HCH transport system substrate-binding protein
MQNHVFETLIGAIVIAVAAVFVFYAYSSTNSGAVRGYEITARFNRVDGISVGSDVKLSGIKVGTVSQLDLDPKTFDAIAHISLAENVKLPDDSSIKVTSEGLLGNSYFSIEPGGSDKDIPPGGQITNTQGSIDLIGLLGKFMFSSGSSGSSNSSSSQPAPQSHP